MFEQTKKIAYDAAILTGAVFGTAEPAYTEQRLLPPVLPVTTTVEIPEEIIKQAKSYGLSEKDIKLIGQDWIACKGDFCYPLGSIAVTNSSLISDNLKHNKTDSGPEKGVFELTNRNYLRVSSDVFHKIALPYINRQHNQNFVIVISVPLLCEPCRLYEPIVKEYAKSIESKTDTKVILVEFDNFSDAKEFIGNSQPGYYRDNPSAVKPAVLFPHTVIVPAAGADWQKYYKANPDKIKTDAENLVEFDGGLKAFLLQDRNIKSFNGIMNVKSIANELQKRIDFTNKQ